MSPDKIERVVTRLIKLAEGGDVQAAKVLLGRVTTAPAHTEPIDLGIDSLSTIADVRKASESILRSMTDGRISPDDGSKLAAMVELVRRSIETQEMEARISALEGEQ